MLSIKQNQNLLDIAVQYTGELDNLMALAQANGISITSALLPGNTLVEVPVTNKRVTTTFERIEYDCTTIMRPPMSHRGIGYMIIGRTFKVG